MSKIKNKRELDRLLKSHTAAEISQMIQNGGLDFDQNKYSITEYEEMGKYGASYTAEYEKQLQQISQQVLGMQNRVDELLSDGYVYAGNHKERINFDHSLLQTGVSPEVVIHAFQKDGKVREILTSGQELFAADKTHIIRAMMELSTYDAQGHTLLADTLGSHRPWISVFVGKSCSLICLRIPVQ